MNRNDNAVSKLETALRRLPRSRAPAGLLFRLLRALWPAIRMPQRRVLWPAALAALSAVAIIPWLRDEAPPAPNLATAPSPGALDSAAGELAQAFTYLHDAAALSSREIDRTVVGPLAASFELARRASPGVDHEPVTNSLFRASDQQAGRDRSG